MHPLLRSGLAALLLYTGSQALGADMPPIPPALHTDPAWLALGHYQADRFAGTYTSQADDSEFFLSPRGKHSPRAELIATVEAIMTPGGGDEHARCRFPARDRWLRQRLDLPERPFDCPAFEDWRSRLNSETVTLVFAASYLNSPSSMFGHTFLRLDPPKDGNSTDLLLANTISYAADAAAHDSELMFAYRGIFGGYPGITTIQPYYEKIRLYSDIEHRDLWEYQLNLTPQEVDQMVAHAWEIRDRNFDYYFFDENCAYRLLALIDVARPGTALLDEVTTHAIPSDTVRWVMDKDLVEQVEYRPSAATHVRHTLDQLPREHRVLVSALAHGYLSVDSTEISALEAGTRALVLDATYDYVRYQSEAQNWSRDHAAPLSHALLVNRSRIPDVPPAPAPPQPNVRDDQGHDTFRLGLAVGEQYGRDFAQLTLRPAYHDLLDPPEGYRAGAQLQFLRLDARLYTDKDELQIEQITGVEIRSLSPRNLFFSPVSWQVGFGGRRTITENGRVLTPYLEGRAGGAWQLGSGLLALAMVTTDLEIDDDLSKGYDIAPGADLGLLYQGHRYSLMAGGRTRAWAVGGRDRQDEVYLDGNLHIGRDFSVFARFSREHLFDRYDSSWQFGLNAYF